jgi:menaquinone-dependent protoporphyrinogen oxidase
MRVLVTWGSKHGGTEGIGRLLAEALEGHGFEVVAAPVAGVGKLGEFDAAIVGGAIYANRWARSARRFVDRHVGELRKIPVWFFSSGPLDDSADRKEIPPPTEVAVLAERVGAKDHVTFGGRLEPDVKGFPASAMAKTRSGDWRNPDQMRAWATELANALPDALPGTPVEHPARSLPRLVAHAAVGWGLCGLAMGLFLLLGSPTLALVLHALAAPLIFVALARHYFGARGARDPFTTAIAWTGIVALLDLLVVAGALQQSLEMFRSIAGTWLPFTLIFLATWITGSVMATMPWPKAEPEQRRASEGEPSPASGPHHR